MRTKRLGYEMSGSPTHVAYDEETSLFCFYKTLVLDTACCFLFAPKCCVHQLQMFRISSVTRFSIFPTVLYAYAVRPTCTQSVSVKVIFAVLRTVQKLFMIRWIRYWETNRRVRLPPSRARCAYIICAFDGRAIRRGVAPAE